MSSARRIWTQPCSHTSEEGRKIRLVTSAASTFRPRKRRRRRPCIFNKSVKAKRKKWTVWWEWAKYFNSFATEKREVAAVPGRWVCCPNSLRKHKMYDVAPRWPLTVATARTTDLGEEELESHALMVRRLTWFNALENSRWFLKKGSCSCRDIHRPSSGCFYKAKQCPFADCGPYCPWWIYS